MDGDSAPGSDSTPDPGSTTGSGPPPGPEPGSPTSPPDLETEWLGLAVDSAEQGGLNPHVMRRTGPDPAAAGSPVPTPSAAPPTAPGTGPTPAGPSLAEDLAAYDQLVDLAAGRDTGPSGVGPRGPWFRQKVVVIRLGFGLSAIALVIILLALLSRPSAGDAPAPGANAPAAPAQGDAAQPPPGDAADPGAGADAGGQQGDVAQPPGDCSVPPGAVTVTVEDVRYEPLNDGAWDLTWNLVSTNTTDRMLLVVERRHAGFEPGTAQGGAPAAPPTSEWGPGQIVYPRDTLKSLSHRTQYPYDSGLGWAYYDRYAVLAFDPACRSSASAAASDPAALEQVATDAPDQPLGP